MISVMKILTAQTLWVLRLSTRYWTNQKEHWGQVSRLHQSQLTWASTRILLDLSDLSSTMAFSPEMIPSTFEQM